MESSGIAGSAKAAAPSGVVSAAGEVTARAGRSVAAADVTAADMATTARVTSTSAPVLRQHRRRNDHRPQNSGCQKKAPTLGTHDFHLQLPASRLRGHLNP
jgi:hypothetical protein